MMDFMCKIQNPNPICPLQENIHPSILLYKYINTKNKSFPIPFTIPTLKKNSINTPPPQELQKYNLLKETPKHTQQNSLNEYIMIHTTEKTINDWIILDNK